MTKEEQTDKGDHQVAPAINLEYTIDRFSQIIENIASDDIVHVIIEYCCDPDSSFGKRAESDTLVVRLTEFTDMTTKMGLASLMTIIEACRQHVKKMTLWSSIPCTGGSQWRNLNLARGRGIERGKQHVETYRLLWNNFTIAARSVVSCCGVIVMEWPKG